MRNRSRWIATAISATLAMGLGAAAVQAQTAGTGDNSAPTRQEKKAELQKLEQNGYQPGSNETNYPADVQDAEKRASGQAPAAGNYRSRRKPAHKTPEE